MDGGKAYALTCPLITKSDGSKFGKSESGNVWLDPTLTSPYKFYQFWLNVTDEEAERLIKVFTLLSQSEIAELIQQHQAAPHLRILQKALAKDVTIRVHSAQEYESAADASEILFGKGDISALRNLSPETLLAVFEGVPLIQIETMAYHNAATVADLLAEVTHYQIFESKGEAKRMIQNGGVSINRQKVGLTDAGNGFELLHNQYLVVQKGKKNYFLVVVLS
jgi:tyrosyl-tRNA synthetase